MMLSLTVEITTNFIRCGTYMTDSPSKALRSEVEKTSGCRVIWSQPLPFSNTLSAIASRQNILESYS